MEAYSSASSHGAGRLSDQEDTPAVKLAALAKSSVSRPRSKPLYMAALGLVTFSAC